MWRDRRLYGGTYVQHYVAMKITFLNQFYPPDIPATAGLLASLADHLAFHGHTVTVVASRATKRDRLFQSRSVNSVRVRRLWTPLFGKRTILGRLVDYAFFVIQAFWTMLSLPRQDVVVSLTTPPFIVLVALSHRIRYGPVKIVLWNMDCYPEIVETTGLMPTGGLTSRSLRAMNRWIMRRLDSIVCLDRAMENLIQNHYGVGEPLPTVVIPNWEPLGKFPRAAVRKRVEDSGHEGVVVLYQGNAGVGHEFDTVLDCAQRLNGAAVTFRFVGGGKWWPWLEQHAPHSMFPRWEVRPYVLGAGGPSLYADASIALITLREACKGIMSPSKLHACLACGLPILYVGPAGTNVDDCIVRFNCGASIRNGDSEAAAAFLRQLVESPALLRRLSANARVAFEAEYTDTHVLPRFDELFRAIAPANGHRSAAAIKQPRTGQE